VKPSVNPKISHLDHRGYRRIVDSLSSNDITSWSGSGGASMKSLYSAQEVHQTPINTTENTVQETNFVNSFSLRSLRFLLSTPNTKPPSNSTLNSMPACLPCALTSANACDGKKTRRRGKGARTELYNSSHQPLLQTKAKSLAPRLLGDSRCTLNSGVMWVWGSNGETGCGEGGTFKWGRNVKESGNSGASSLAPGVRVLPRLPIPFILDF
jgi:hypothetical protein